MSALQRILGGSPFPVLLRLIVLSLIVGAIMAGLGLTPASLVQRLAIVARSLFGLSFDAVRDAGRYVLYGAVIVIPIWLLMRITGGSAR